VGGLMSGVCPQHRTTVLIPNLQPASFFGGVGSKFECVTPHRS
ncbi:hypothetical protein A2U01_0060639, partial [Trifolium medium]|nr:hypothetical protein [Trifolium medium]